jgi:polyisoprenoid-binding protein YceI
MKRILGVVACLLAGGVVCAGQSYHLDASNSLIEVHVGSSGAFGFLGHEHLIQTRLRPESVVVLSTNSGLSRVEVVVDAKGLRVADPELSAKDRQKVQAKMESERVLGVNKFPTIAFKSTSVSREGERGLVVSGNLTLRGQTRGIVLRGTVEQGEARLRVTGSTQFKQTEFGIKPVSAGLGAVRVKDVVRVTFLACGEAVK